MEQTETKRRGYGWLAESRIILGGLALLCLIAATSVIQAWSQGQTASRAEVAQTIANVDPACRRIIAAAMQSRFMQDRRPLTRRELADVADGFTSCKAINDQLDGMADALRQQ